MGIQLIKKTLKDEAQKEVKDNILKFWLEQTIDHENGGFLGAIKNDLSVVQEAPKSSVLNTRILWTYSKAYHMFGDPKYLELANRAYDFIINNLWDKEYGGLFWIVDYVGKPLDSKKQIYGQAFGIYALTEYYIATKKQESLDYAVKIYEKIEKHSYDSENRGYFEACTREWAPTDDLQLAKSDMNEKKSMNTHLHILEAYTNLYRVWKDKAFKEQLEDLIKVTIEHIIDPETYHFKLFFDEKWHSKSGIISYGHDIEGSWLLLEAAQVLGNEKILDKSKEVALSMAQKTYEKAIDKDGAIINEMLEDGSLDEDRIWWVQAEAVVGFINAYQMTGKAYFLEAATNTWTYIKDFVIDQDHGEWFWMVSKEGVASQDYLKVDPWKCPYHNSRACFEIIERLA